MMKTRKKFLVGILSALMAVCISLCITGFGQTETVKAETSGTYNVYVVKSWAGNIQERPYNKENVNDLASALDEVMTKYYNGDFSDTTYNYKCVIELNTDASTDALNRYSWYLPMELVLNGHTLQVSHSGSGYFYNGLRINGGDGKMIQPSSANYRQDAPFWIKSGQLIVTNTKINDFKTADYPVFGIRASSSEAFFENCKFDNCHSSAYGGAIYAGNVNYLSLKNCTFNNCSSYYGGAIFMENLMRVGGSVLDTNNCDFTNCKATGYGGALYVEDNCAWDDDNDDWAYQKLYFNNCTMSSCEAGYDGGAIYVDYKNGYIDSNNENKLSINNCKSSRYGGAIYTSGNNFHVQYIDIQSCSAKYGGGIFIDSYNTILNHLEIHKCSASKDGGGYYANCTLDAEYSNGISGNSPSDSYGTIKSSGSLTVIFGVLAGVFLITAGVFAFLYSRIKKRS